MRTRTEEEMLQLVVGFARADERIRVVLMNGSRANPNAPKDPFQDYDIANFVTDVEPYKIEQNVLPHFGDAIVVEQPNFGPWPPADADGSYHNYNMQFLDGNRIDLSFYRLEVLEKHAKDSLTSVLLDKDNRLPSLAPANESSYFLAPPSASDYSGCCEGFFFTLGSHIPKTVWRRRLSLLKFYIEACLREPMLMMLGWEVGARTGWDKSLGHQGVRLEKYLTPDVWEEYVRTFAGSDYGEIWDSLFLAHRIFVRSARFVADKFSYEFPEQQATRVKAFLEHVRDLPADAERIFEE
jgi:aminoglycoside 6-adenylyltransferase